MIWQKFVFLIFCVHLSVSQVRIELRKVDHQVQVEEGTLVGKKWALNGKKVAVFKGVPYAQQPVDNLRFKKPMKQKKWVRHQYAQTAADPCIQFMDFNDYDRFSGSSMKKQTEECLYLNIYAPYYETGTKQFPVLVWIHGGSFFAGSADTSLDEDVTIQNLVLRDVILVTINYRLGPLGFLSGSPGLAKGNYGLWDQIEALRWVKANIQKFAGDPNNVTIMGESAGGASVSILALSPETKDLIHGAIIMSGSSAAGWAVERTGGKTGYTVENLYNYITCNKAFHRENMAHTYRTFNASFDEKSLDCNLMKKRLECPASTEEEKLDCLRKADFSDMMFKKALTAELGVSKAVVDGEIIPYNIDELLSNSSRIPILTGVAGGEWIHKKAKYYGLGAYRPVSQAVAKEKISAIIHDSLKQRFNEQVSNRTLDAITALTFQRYVRDQSSIENWTSTDFVRQLRNIESDIEFVAPCQREAEAYARNNVSVYLYTFDHVPKAPFREEDYTHRNLFGSVQHIKIRSRLKFSSAFHGLDHAFIFSRGYVQNMEFEYDEDDEKISNIMCEMITNFVKTKKPLPDWQPYTLLEPKYAHIRVPFSVEKGDFYRTNASFWNELVPYAASHLGSIEASRPAPLTDEERVQLAAYRRAWWALWILVAAIAVVLWTIVICLVAQKCMNAKSTPYKNIIVANS